MRHMSTTCPNDPHRPLRLRASRSSALQNTVGRVSRSRDLFLFGPRIFFKNRHNLPDTFLLELRKKKMGVTVLVFALRTKLSPTVIDTVAKLTSQIRRSRTIRFSTRPLHPTDWTWCSLLNSELWTRSIVIRFRSSRGSQSNDVTTGSSYLNQFRFPRMKVKVL